MLTDFLEGLLRYLDNVQRDAFESEKPTGAMLAEGKLFPTADAFEDNDQEFFAVLEKDFLDWFMEVQDAPHRTVRALRTHERKFKGELFEGESMTDRVTVTPKDRHMPVKYYQEYIRKIGGIDDKVPSDGQFSKYNDDFHNFLAVAAQAMRRAD